MITCKFEDGANAKLRHVVTDAIVVKNNQILLVKRSQKYSEPGKYALPGGFLDRDESADQGVIREVLEETGYQSEVVTLFQIIHQPRNLTDQRQNVGFVYLVTPKSQVQSPDNEIDSIHWFDLSKLPTPETVAFDHFNIIQLYQKHLQHTINLPITNFHPQKLTQKV